jgi:hypothetical protein
MLNNFDWRWQCTTTGLNFPNVLQRGSGNRMVAAHPVYFIADRFDPWFKLIVVLIVSPCVDDGTEIKEKALAMIKRILKKIHQVNISQLKTLMVIVILMTLLRKRIQLI